jgi:hypothetical protein
LHADSGKEDRKNYISSVDKWAELDLLVISPVISHGVNFDQQHFDELFVFGTDLSTMPCQLFQQALRVRRISSNQVHMHLRVDPRKHAHLTYDYVALKQELEQQMRCYERDNVQQMGFGKPAARYTIDRNAWEEGRRVLDTLPNELYLHNQRRINYGKRHFRDEMLRLIRETGGRVHPVQADSIAEVKQGGAIADIIREADEARKLSELEAVLRAEDLNAEAIAGLEFKERHHELEPKEAAALRKVKWKLTYGIELTDTERMASIDNFASRFGTDHRIEQAETLQKTALAAAAALRPALSADSDPIPYRWGNVQLREHTVSLLTAVGLDAPAGPPAAADRVEAPPAAIEPESILRASTIVNSTVQAGALEPGLELRIRVLHDLEHAPMNHKVWWNTLKRKHKWLARDRELYDEGDAPVSSKELHKAMLRRARQFLNAYYGVKIGSKRLGRGAGRGTVYQLDRTRWNEFSQTLFRLPPQVLHPDWLNKSKKKSAAKKEKGATDKSAKSKKDAVAKKGTGTRKPPKKKAARKVAAEEPLVAAALRTADMDVEWMNLPAQPEIDGTAALEATRQAVGGPEELCDVQWLQQQGRHEDAEEMMAAMAVGIA